MSSGKTALTDAITQAAAGDTLVLQPGIYRERVRIEKPLTLRGTPGAIMDGAEDLKVAWTAAEGEWKNVFTAPMPKRPHGLLVDGKFIAEIRFDRAQSKGDWHWQTLLAKGPPLSGFKQIRALWIYHPKEQRIYARFEDGAAPDRLNLSYLKSAEALLAIGKTKGVVVEGVAFAHGSTAVEVTAGAVDAVVRRCSVTSYENTGIALTGGASKCTVEECEITRGSFEEWQAELPTNRINYEIWKVHKAVGNYDRVGIELIHAGAGNRILRNKLDRVFDGICLGDSSVETLDKPLKNPDDGRDTEIAFNVIENTRDSGIELGVGCINVNVHHNTLRRTHGGLRFKVPRIGPAFVHHNLLLSGAPFQLWFSMDAAPAEGYVYHNTFVSDQNCAAVEYSSFNAQRDVATPKWHFLNNLALTPRGFFERNKGTPAPDFLASHNVIAGKGQPWPGDATRDLGSRYEVMMEVDSAGRPQAGSPAIDAGLDLSAYLKGRPLPGCEPGYFRGKGPDAGAAEVK